MSICVSGFADTAICVGVGAQCVQGCQCAAFAGLGERTHSATLSASASMGMAQSSRGFSLGPEHQRGFLHGPEQQEILAGLRHSPEQQGILERALSRGPERRSQGAGHRAQSTEHRAEAQSTGPRAQGTEHRAQSTEQKPRAQVPGQRAPTLCRTAADTPHAARLLRRGRPEKGGQHQQEAGQQAGDP